MKISSASKKVLASALSAAMVVAFAPTVAFAAAVVPDSTAANGKVKVNLVDASGASYDVYFADTLDSDGDVETTALQKAFDAIKSTEGIQVGTKEVSQTSTNASGVTTTQIVEVPVNKVATSCKSVTVSLLDDVIGQVEYEGAAAITLDLGDYNISNFASGTEAEKAYKANSSGDFDTLTVPDGKVTLTAGTGTVKAVDYVDADGSTVKNNDSIDGNVTIAAGTYEDIAGTATMKAGKVGATKGVTVAKNATAEAGAVDGTATLKAGAVLTVTASSAKEDAAVTGVKGIELGKDSKLTVNASASGDDSSVVGVDLSSVNADTTLGTADDSASLVVNAAATGVDTDNDGDATATGVKLKGGEKLSFANGTYTVKATSDDAYGSATAVEGKVEAKSAKASVELSADAYKAANAFAVKGSLEAATGTYTGKVGTVDSSTGAFTSSLTGLTGGQYTQKPAKSELADADKYVVEDVDGTYWKVSQAKGFGIQVTDISKAPEITLTDADGDIEGYVEDAMQQIAAGATSVKGMTFAEGVTAADVLKQARESVTPVLTTTAYNAKKETAASKAAKDAVEAYNKANLTKLATSYGENVYTVSLTLAYKKTGSSEWTTLATIDSLGTKVDGRANVDRKVVLTQIHGTGLEHSASTVVAFDGTAANALAWDVEDKETKDTVSLNAIPTAVAVVTTDDEALKEAVINNGNNKPAAAEKATQGIDVAKKSKTVKLAKKATKTKKAQSFSMGVSAETAVTTAKKSGSKYVTVKGGKVTLKKGVKKGTYTAKVSIKAAASDQYLAAAKTVTVKFTVKK